MYSLIGAAKVRMFFYSANSSEFIFENISNPCFYLFTPSQRTLPFVRGCKDRHSFLFYKKKKEKNTNSRMKIK